jgi:hypothetical protein
MKKVGIFIIVIGLGIIVFTIFSSFTKEKIAEPKQVEMDKNKQRELNWYPLIGIGALGIGAVILKLASEK